MSEALNKGKKKNIKDKQAGGNAKQVSLGYKAVRYEYYRDGYRALNSLVLIQSVFILVFMSIAMYFFNTYKAERVNFATTNSGKLIPLVALDNPNLTKPTLIAWAATVASEVLSFGFSDYRPRLNEAARHFTRIGWESFTDALAGSGYMKTIDTKQAIFTAIPAGAPIVVKEGMYNGRYQWDVSVKMRITVQSGGEKKSKTSNVNITIVRVPYLESPNGVGIERWIQR